MGYKEALEATGAEIIAFNNFGDYQGSWYAKVKYNDQVGWVIGSYGSCSGCDAFQSEFGYIDYENYELGLSEHQKKLKEFGEQYLKSIVTDTKKILKELEERSEWDLQADDIIKFVVSQDLLYNLMILKGLT